MKKILYILTGVFLCACHTEDPLEDEMLIQTRIVAENTEQAATLSVTADGDPIVAVGRYLTNPFSVGNMNRVLTGIKAKDPALLPLRIPSGCLADLQYINPFNLKPSHYYIKITPTSEEQFNLLKEDSTLNLYSYPLNCEINGEGIIPFESVETDLADLQGAPKDPFQPLYASIPVYKSLPAGIHYSILDELYIPDEIDETQATRSGTISVSPGSAELWIELSMYLTGYLTADQVNENYTRSRSRWQPSGTIRVYDDEIKDYVPVPHAKVRTRRWFTTHWTYTNDDGHFVIGHTYKRPVNYSIAWESDKWDIRDGRIVQAFYNGPKQKAEWNLDINGGKSQRYATITRALCDHFYRVTPTITDRVDINRHIKIGYRHKSSNIESGHFNLFVVGGVSLDIVIMGRTNYGWSTTDQILGTTFHELGHCAMFHKVGGISAFNKYASNVQESWAELNEWYLTKANYKALGHNICKYVQYDYPSKIIINRVYFEKENYLNHQGMSQWDYKNNKTYQTYTPIFIDLVDDSNQKEYYRIFEKDNSMVYPDDKLCIKNYALLNRVIYASKTLGELKANLLANSEKLVKSPQDIIDYFSFYEL